MIENISKNINENELKLWLKEAFLSVREDYEELYKMLINTEYDYIIIDLIYEILKLN